MYHTQPKQQTYSSAVDALSVLSSHVFADPHMIRLQKKNDGGKG
jgi:hypothetical protein